jgi:hypothetical protein
MSMQIAYFFSPEIIYDIFVKALFIAYGILFYVDIPFAPLKSEEFGLLMLG